jgi:hypothetical protein
MFGPGTLVDALPTFEFSGVTAPLSRGAAATSDTHRQIDESKRPPRPIPAPNWPGPPGPPAEGPCQRSCDALKQRGRIPAARLKAIYFEHRQARPGGFQPPIFPAWARSIAHQLGLDHTSAVGFFAVRARPDGDVDPPHSPSQQAPSSGLGRLLLPPCLHLVKARPQMMPRQTSCHEGSIAIGRPAAFRTSAGLTILKGASCDTRPKIPAICQGPSGLSTVDASGKPRKRGEDRLPMLPPPRVSRRHIRLPASPAGCHPGAGCGRAARPCTGDLSRFGGRACARVVAYMCKSYRGFMRRQSPMPPSPLPPEEMPSRGRVSLAGVARFLLLLLLPHHWPLFLTALLTLAQVASYAQFSGLIPIFPILHRSRSTAPSSSRSFSSIGRANSVRNRSIHRSMR